MLEKIESKEHAFTQSIVHKVSSISLSDGSGGSSVAKLVTYEVNAEKRPDSWGRSTRSTTWEGFCRGISGISVFEDIDA